MIIDLFVFNGVRCLKAGFTVIFILGASILYAQVRVELNDRIRYPEVYFWKHLHDTILVANEGFKFSNFASVKFEVDKNGFICNITFSTYTDSLVMPHVTNVLMTTNKKWLVTRAGKTVKDKVTILLPVLFIFKSQQKEPVERKEDILSLHPIMSAEEQMLRIFHFSLNRDENFEVHKRKGEKFEGIALNPIEVIVPLNPTESKY